MIDGVTFTGRIGMRPTTCSAFQSSAACATAALSLAKLELKCIKVLVRICGQEMDDRWHRIECDFLMNGSVRPNIVSHSRAQLDGTIKVGDALGLSHAFPTDNISRGAETWRLHYRQATADRQ